MTKPDKVIFLDIDGPMISNTDLMFNKFASWSQQLGETNVKVLHLILEASNAKLVFNTTHNDMYYNGDCSGRVYDTPGLRQRFVDAGFEKYIHKVETTKFPELNRYDAITNWLSENKTDNMLWVALDDVKMPHKRCCLVNPNYGLGVPEYNFCAKYLMFKPKLYL